MSPSASVAQTLDDEAKPTVSAGDGMQVMTGAFCWARNVMVTVAGALDVTPSDAV